MQQELIIGKLNGSPLLRGNNGVISVEKGRLPGSPPLAREQPVNTYQDRIIAGITPACAGTT